MATKITKEASVFYFTYALLRASKHYLQYLIDSKSVSGTIKRDLRNIINRINDLDRTAKNGLEEKDYSEWQREWTGKDYEVFASIFSEMNDMSEEKRGVLEEFAKELSKGNVSMVVEDAEQISPVDFGIDESERHRLVDQIEELRLRHVE